MSKLSCTVCARLSLVMLFVTLRGRAEDASASVPTSVPAPTPAPAPAPATVRAPASPSVSPDYADARLAEVDPEDDGSGTGTRSRRAPRPRGYRSEARRSEPSVIDTRDEALKYMHRNVSLTLAPLLLLSPILEATLEIRLFGKKQPVALAVIGGYGKGKGKVTSGTRMFDMTTTASGIGGQFLWYPVRCFESLQLGMEALYFNADFELSDQVVTGRGTGLSIGPIVGYKWILRPDLRWLHREGSPMSSQTRRRPNRPPAQRQVVRTRNGWVY